MNTPNSMTLIRTTSFDPQVPPKKSSWIPRSIKLGRTENPAVQAYFVQQVLVSPPFVSFFKRRQFEE